jgi:transposase-like protein
VSKQSRQIAALTLKIADELGVRYCTSCNRTQKSAGGKTKVILGKRSRWMCATCATKNKPSGFNTRREDAVPQV